MEIGLGFSGYSLLQPECPQNLPDPDSANRDRTEHVDFAAAAFNTSAKSQG